MEAIKYYKARKVMCDTYSCNCCKGCPLYTPNALLCTDGWEETYDKINYYL